MDISIIICTYNRAEHLADTLESLFKLNFPPSVSVEILAVDNNSSDSTADVVNRFQINHPSISYIFEATAGLSHARNRGIKEAKGNIITFIDDDSINLVTLF